ncbi:MAG: 5'-nucleotidase C-terminal domain-containing protein [Candidatus Bipolaricaulota bacterium]|nr:5'-nucleotidase C-terminal domain-containing protein [Candidatus Bipolaricaulota bacterium]
MNDRSLWWWLVVLALALLIVAFARQNPVVSPPDLFVGVRILHTQEHHGQALPIRGGNPPLDCGGLAARATLIAQQRADAQKNRLGVLLVDSGDILVGTPLSTVFRGEPDIIAMNAMGYDLMVPGNHEFDFEPREQRYKKLAELAQFPFVVANIEGFEHLGLAQPQPAFLIKRFGSLRVGIIGITHPNTPNSSSPPKGVIFSDAVSAVRRVLEQHRAEADIWVAVTHQENFRDLELLRAVPEVDVIIGGHTYGFRGIVTRDALDVLGNVAELIPDQPTEIERPNGIFVRAGEGPFLGRLGTALGQLDLIVDPKTKEITKARAANLLILPATEHNLKANVPVIAPDPQIEALLRPYLDELAVRVKEVIAQTTVDLEGRREIVRRQETNLGNLITDIYRERFGTDIAFQNGGGIRASIPAGAITIEQILTVLPFANTLTTFRLKGSELLLALENSVSQVEQGAGRFLQVSGMCLSFDREKPVGERVLKVFVGRQPLDPQATYSIAAPSFLANGGDGYTVFREQRSEFLDTQLIDADLVIEGLRQRESVSPQVEGRITEGGAKTACE